MKWAGLLLLPVAGLALAPTRSAPPPPKPFDTKIVPYLKVHCLGCHQKGAASAGLELESFLSAASLEKDPDSWKHFVHKIRTGQMPPPGSPKPDTTKSKLVTDWVSAELVRREKATKPRAGRVTARRLNRAEYNNTVRDLLGVTVRPADDFPQDDSGYGFDTIGDVLSVSPPLFEKYLVAAEKVARAAVFGPEKLPPRLIELRPARREPPPPLEIPKKYDETGLTLPQASHTLYRFPADGQYEIHGVLTGLRPEDAEPLNCALWIDGKKVAEKTYDPQGIPSFPGGPKELYGQKILFPRVPVVAGEHWVAVAIEKYYEGFPARFGGPNPSKRPAPPAPPARNNRFFEPPADATPEQIAEFEERRKRFEEQRKKQNAELPENTRMGMLEVGGPYAQRLGQTATSRTKLSACGHTNGKHTDACAPKLLSDVATRAFRRPLQLGEAAKYTALFTDARKQGESFDEALCMVLQAVLVSPHFLFRVERPAAGTLTDHELATRLSYFLWSTLPDAELRRAADTGTLRRPEVLEAQVRRMLASPKADALIENFAGQWLELRKLESLRPDREKYNGFDEHLRISMRKETELFFKEIVKSDRSVLDFIDGKFTFVNQRLAEFYGMPAVPGLAFRKVSLEGTKRGGILTQASILTVTSFPNRTSPVLRGKWILDNLLNTPPPPAPPGVPSLEETKVSQGASLRQQLEEHRKKPLCASCHAKLDPLGFGLENFDGIGAWREKDGTGPILASGVLPDGAKFDGPQELTAILKKDKDVFVRCLANKLMTYALGRGLERYDQPTVQQIADKTSKNNYKFSSLVLGIVTSLPFQQQEGTTNHALPASSRAVSSNSPPRSGSGTGPSASRRHDARNGGARPG